MWRPIANRCVEEREQKWNYSEQSHLATVIAVTLGRFSEAEGNCLLLKTPHTSEKGLRQCDLDLNGKSLSSTLVFLVTERTS